MPIYIHTQDRYVTHWRKDILYYSIVRMVKQTAFVKLLWIWGPQWDIEENALTETCKTLKVSSILGHTSSFYTCLIHDLFEGIYYVLYKNMALCKKVIYSNDQSNLSNSNSLSDAWRVHSCTKDSKSWVNINENVIHKQHFWIAVTE